MTSKVCTKCCIQKDTSEFYVRGDRNGLRSVCIICMYPPIKKSCELCNSEWIAKPGSAKRKLNRCDACYPIYRRADKLHFAARHRAKKQNVAFDLTIEYVEKKLKEGCQRTGLPFDLTVGSGGKTMENRNSLSPSLDKINPSLGYTKENTQFVVWFYNVAKQRWTDEEVYKLCESVVSYNKKNNEKHTQLIMPGLRV